MMTALAEGSYRPIMVFIYTVHYIIDDNIFMEIQYLSYMLKIITIL